MGDKLKPCPCCGGKPYNFNKGNFAMCITDGCGLENAHMTHDQWNTRAAEADLVEALRSVASRKHGSDFVTITRDAYNKVCAALEAYDAEVKTQPKTDFPGIALGRNITFHKGEIVLGDTENRIFGIITEIKGDIELAVKVACEALAKEQS